MNPAQILDIIAAVILGLNILIATIRGAVKEIINLLAIIIGIVAAKTQYKIAIPHMKKLINQSDEICAIASYFAVFVGVWLAIKIIGAIINKIINLSKGISIYNRLFGSVLGILKASIIIFVLIWAGLLFESYLPDEIKSAVDNSFTGKTVRNAKPHVEKFLGKFEAIKPFIVTTKNVEVLTKKLKEDPEGTLEALRTSPQIQSIMNHPDIVQLQNSPRVMALVKQQRFDELLSSDEVKKVLENKQIRNFITNNDFEKMLSNIKQTNIKETKTE
jgi:uncharacterized membrane protein required for colicin V production